MSADSDTALDTLFLPFIDARLTWPDDALFLRARDGAVLRRDWQGLICAQSFKPAADALERAGHTLVTDADLASAKRQFAIVLVLPPRQRDEARALLARAITLTKDGGRVVVCVSNDEGARSSESDLKQLVGNVTTLSKNKCRVFWSEPLYQTERLDLVKQWLGLDAERPIADGRFVSRPGVFAWDRIDPASALLAAHLPNDLAGRAADLGTGFGYLSAELLTRCPHITALDAYEAEQRALALARTNLAPFETRTALRYHWHDVTSGLPHRYDVIVTNPPFHTHDSTGRPDIGRRFIAVAAEALNPGGRLWLVANRHLPYESILDATFGTVRLVTQENGFKIISAIKAPASKMKASQSKSAPNKVARTPR